LVGFSLPPFFCAYTRPLVPTNTFAYTHMPRFLLHTVTTGSHTPLFRRPRFRHSSGHFTRSRLRITQFLYCWRYSLDVHIATLPSFLGLLHTPTTPHGSVSLHTFSLFALYFPRFLSFRVRDHTLCIFHVIVTSFRTFSFHFFFFFLHHTCSFSLRCTRIAVHTRYHTLRCTQVLSYLTHSHVFVAHIVCLPLFPLTHTSHTHTAFICSSSYLSYTHHSRVYAHTCFSTHHSFARLRYHTPRFGLLHIGSAPTTDIPVLPFPGSFHISIYLPYHLMPSWLRLRVSHGATHMDLPSLHTRICGHTHMPYTHGLHTVPFAVYGQHGSHALLVHTFVVHHVHGSHTCWFTGPIHSHSPLLILPFYRTWTLPLGLVPHTVAPHIHTYADLVGFAC